MSNMTVDLHVDPLCPWCWLTALWLYEAEMVRPFTVRTRVFSLAEVNRDDVDHRTTLESGERALRLLVAARRIGGERMARSLYLHVGEARHERGEHLDDAVLTAAATEAGLADNALEEAVADPSTAAELAAEHAEICERGAFGVPTLSVDGNAPFFGPIIDERITGEAAGELWDAVAPLLINPRVFELKRPRTGRPAVGRHRVTAGA